MTAFDRAWDLVKMASYKVGPTEFWDVDERDRSWTEETDDGRDFFLMVGSPVFGNYKTKVMMKPQDYLRLVSPIRGLGGRPAREAYGSILQDYIKDNPRTDRIIEGMRAGKPTFIPNLVINQRGDITEHEGRHRMAAILQLMGNRPVPTQLSSTNFPNMRDNMILDAIRLRGQYDDEQELALEPEMFFNVGDVE